jgi:hypothetical protein
MPGPNPVAARSYRQRRDTCKLSALSVNLRRRRHPVIWGHEGLPSDASALSAVPRGGALVLAQNLLLYYTQAGQVGRERGRGFKPGRGLTESVAGAGGGRVKRWQRRRRVPQQELGVAAAAGPAPSPRPPATAPGLLDPGS